MCIKPHTEMRFPKVAKKEFICLTKRRFLCNRLKHGAVFVVCSSDVAGSARFAYGLVGTMNVSKDPNFMAVVG
jgi:hypothetical protein